MLPLNDTEPNRYSHFPFMTIAIIWINVMVMGFEFIVLQESRDGFRQLLDLYGTVPALLLSSQGGGTLSSITTMFLHGGLLHLFGNMLALWVFGRRVEDACGPWGFLFFYLTCGFLANIAHVIFSADSVIPAIGASGAISGVMGAYLLLFPGGRIRTLVFLWIIPTWPKIRAFFIVIYFLIVNIIPALSVVLNNTDYNIAYWAHLGGFFACFSVFFFLRPEAFQRYFSKAPV
ncbi:MAG: rhomboid family intramembrane serine protease [Chloroflexi bacterium]|nr:rhomboid family intramembrane serine protease [Chloroflexota bacterium]